MIENLEKQKNEMTRLTDTRVISEKELRWRKQVTHWQVKNGNLQILAKENLALLKK